MAVHAADSGYHVLQKHAPVERACGEVSREHSRAVRRERERRRSKGCLLHPGATGFACV